MGINQQQLKAIFTGTESERIESLRQLLGYTFVQRDPQGSRFWYFRPAENDDDIADTLPIAVGFFPELNDLTSDKQVKQYFTSDEQDGYIRGHYFKANIENQPVIYLLFPTEIKGRVAFILPTETHIRHRGIHSFATDEHDLLARLNSLHWDELQDRILERAINLIPQVDWIFYKPTATAQELAQELAIATQRIEQAIPQVYNAESDDGYLHQLLSSFQKELLPNLKIASTDQKEYSFADIYAQTIAYGLFTARVFSYVKNPKNDFSRKKAYEKLPETNPFLKRLFQDISDRKSEELGDELLDAISEIVGILRAAKMDAILTYFRNNMNREDIVIRFYEDFLACYKPQMRERRGVYYTPEPVVSYMVRSVDEMIKDKFNKPLGLADPEVMILDPACGTGTFLFKIFQLIYERFQESPDLLTKGLKDKSWDGYVSECLLPRIFGFELLVAPYSICHLKLGLFLEETGYQFKSGKRLGVYLINTLEDVELREEKQQFSLQIPQMEEMIAAEAKSGSLIKKTEPIMIVIGNPPYSGISSNNGEWITNLIEDYKYINGEHFGERKHWLQDDYVKFIRFSQWRIDKSGQGILAFINNHSFLDNPTFRGMRWHLLNTFDDINIINLHGNSLKKEACPDGSHDQNVFDIQQGVSINLFIKHQTNKTQLGQVNYTDLWGNRELKYKTLLPEDLNLLQLNKITYSPPYYFFLYKDETGREEYENGMSINEIFPNNSSGIVTMGDAFIIADNTEELEARLKDFLTIDYREEELKAKYNLGKNYAKWIIENKDSITLNKNDFIEILYRPFDKKWTVFDNKLVWRWRFETMKQMLLGENLGLTVGRAGQVIDQGEWNILFCTKNITELNLYRRGGNNLFPLYIYPDPNKPQELQQEKRANFSQKFLQKIEAKLGYLPTPEAIFYYIYAVFHSPTYRSRYAEFLKIDFPRVPLTSNNDLFTKLSEIGEKLVQLHLMTSPIFKPPLTPPGEAGCWGVLEFISKGDHKVAPGHPKYSQNSVIINKQGDCFKGVSEEVWNFYIGGYQVCQKWLKDRKDRTLSEEDILHYQKIVIAISETIKLMQLIEVTIPCFPLE